MPRTHAPYPPEFRRQMVELVRSGRSVEGLAREFEPSNGAIRNWVKQADLDEGRRSDGLTTEEREELRHEEAPCSGSDLLTQAGLPGSCDDEQFTRSFLFLFRAVHPPQLRRDNKRLRMEQEILKKAAAWFARESNSIPERGSSS